MTVTVQIKNNVVNVMGEASKHARLHLRQAFSKVGYGLVTYIKTNKLAGDPLHQRSGRLAESIHAENTSNERTISVRVGTNVRYAAVHEYGFNDVVNVRAHLRLSKNGIKFPVRAHTMDMKMPERSFMRSSLREYYTTAIGIISQAVAEIKVKQ